MTNNETILTDWISKNLPGDCVYRRVGNTFEVKYSIKIDPEVNYMIPNYKNMLPFWPKHINIFEQNEGIFWREMNINGKKVGSHFYEKQFTVGVNFEKT